jgi:hypothetical protein
MSALQQSNLDGGAKRKTKKVVKKRGGGTPCGYLTCSDNEQCKYYDEGETDCVPKATGGAKRKTKKVVKKKRGGGAVCTFDPNDPNGGVCGTIKEGDVCRRIFSSANAVCVSREYADRLDADKAEKEVKLEAMRADMAARAAEYGGAKRKTKKLVKKKQKGGTLCKEDEDCSNETINKECYFTGLCGPTRVDGGGPTKANVVYKGGSYVVHIGKRGGKYIVVKGKKVYVNKK